MPDGRDVVLLYGPPWDGATRVSKHHLARYLAGRGYRVLYVEAPLSPLALARWPAAAPRAVASTLRPPRAVAAGLWTRRYFNPVPFHDVLPLTRRRAANALGQRLLAPFLRRDLRRLGFDPSPILVAGLPHVVDLLPGLPRRALVYHCADDYAQATGFPRTLPALERELCQQADLVVTTTETLCRDRARYNPHAYWIPNGVDVEHFERPAAPARELAALPRPLVGFVGALGSWVDVGLLRALAHQRPHWSLVLIGPPGTDLAPLRDLPNVHLLGPRPYPELPDYLAAMDVGLVPFARDGLTHHADPIKVYEYLAAGLPVVATDLPALRRLGHVVRLAGSPQAFVEQVDRTLLEGRDAGRPERQAEAAGHSWSSRFERFEALLRDRLSA